MPTAASKQGAAIIKAVQELRRAKYRKQSNPTWTETRDKLCEITGLNETDGSKLIAKLFNSDKNLYELALTRELTTAEWEKGVKAKNLLHYLFDFQDLDVDHYYDIETGEKVPAIEI